MNSRKNLQKPYSDAFETIPPVHAGCSLRHAELVKGSGDLGGLAVGGPAEDLAGDFGEFRQCRLGGPAEQGDDASPVAEVIEVLDVFLGREAAARHTKLRRWASSTTR